MGSERCRLAAIVAADVAGYSRLMGRDEAGTLAALKAIRRYIVDPLVAAHRGRIVKTTGDGLLLEFGSVVDAVRCAIEVQTGVAAHAADVPKERRVTFRIGINLGDVIVEDDDIFGDGVNVAARLEGIADPGGLCLSDDAMRQVRGRIEAVFEDLGPQSLKNIALPVRAWRWSAGTPAHDRSDGLTLPDKPSIAVLPFQNMSGDPEQEYFADGMVEDIITALSRSRSLFVIARNSSFTYKGKPIDIKGVGRELGVRYVLEGSVRKAGGRVRITGQLIEAASGAHLWAERFDGALEDVFDLQDQVTTSVVGAVLPTLDLAEIERARRKPVGNLDAYDTFLRGLGKMYEFKPGTWDEAHALFLQAMTQDPSFARPYAYAARCHSVRKTMGRVKDRDAEEVEVRRLAARVAAIGHDDAVAMAWAGHSLMFVCFELDQGGAMVEQATIANPNDAVVWQLKGSVSMYRGEHAQAIAELERALRMSPIGPDAYHIEQTMAAALLFSGRTADCQKWCARILAHIPGATLGLQMSAVAHALEGNAEAARQVMERLLKVRPDMTISNQRDIHPMRRAEDRAHWIDGLRLAGLPE